MAKLPISKNKKKRKYISAVKIIKKLNKILLLFVLVLLDQLAKYTSKHQLIRITDIIAIRYMQNYGAAFGILPGRYPIFIIVAVLFIIAILSNYKKAETSFSRLGMIFLLGGTIGNLIDRVVYHFVRDFISIWIFPVFNLADMYNIAGVLLILYSLIKERRI